MIVAQGSQFFLLKSALVQVEHVHLLHEDGKCRLCCLSNLLVDTFSLQHKRHRYFYIVFLWENIM